MATRVGIVEDCLEFREAFAAMIALAPDMCLHGMATDLAGGMALLERSPCDVLLVDLGLPDGDGISLIRAVRARWADACDILVISVFGDNRRVFGAIAAGATGYLLKDSTPMDVLREIRELRAGGSPISPSIARRSPGACCGDCRARRRPTLASSSARTNNRSWSTWPRASVTSRPPV